MSIYTYVVDHGDESPRVSAGQTTITGKVLAVQFSDALAELEQLRESIDAIADESVRAIQADGTHEII